MKLRMGLVGVFVSAMYFVNGPYLLLATNKQEALAQQPDMSTPGFPGAGRGDAAFRPGWFAERRRQERFGSRPNQNPGEQGHRGQGKRMAEALGLSSEQMQQMRLLKEKRQDMRKLSDEMRDARASLTQMFKDQAKSEDDIRSQARQVGDLMLRLHTERVETFLAMRKILTPEQLQKFGELMQQRRGRGQGAGHFTGGSAGARMGASAQGPSPERQP